MESSGILVAVCITAVVVGSGCVDFGGNDIEPVKDPVENTNSTDSAPGDNEPSNTDNQDQTQTESNELPLQDGSNGFEGVTP